jgi:hypothetical protein
VENWRLSRNIVENKASYGPIAGMLLKIQKLFNY